MSTIQPQYQATLDYLFTRLPMFQRQGAAAYKKDLGNTLALCGALGNPQHAFPSIHVGGTNGKGSVSHLLSACLQMAGFKVGLYVSPHYRDFRERIKINGAYVSEDFVVDFCARVKPLIEEIEPSFFEITVAMAFDYFRSQEVDIAIIEVGLGGRLDSTNVITPLVSVITNISYDHMDLLGNTLPEIAMEKAGIIKPGIPVVIGNRHPETEGVFIAKAQETGSELFFAAQCFQCRIREQIGGISLFDVTEEGQAWPDPLKAEVLGIYQQENLATVLQTLRVLDTTAFPYQWQEGALRMGLQHLRSLTNFLGRWMQVGSRPTVILDSGHNEAGIRSAMQQLSTIPHKHLHIVFGMVRDKDPGKILDLLPRDASYYFCKADIPRGKEAAELAQEASAYGLRGQVYGSVTQAYEAARSAAGEEDLVFVGGSIFVVAEVV